MDKKKKWNLGAKYCKQQKVVMNNNLFIEEQDINLQSLWPAEI